MHTQSTSDTRPLVFLDIDGVINDLNSLYNGEVEGIDKVESNGYTVHIPDYMPGLIQELVKYNQVIWLTTWREKANDEIREHLGIPELPVLTDGRNARSVRWKPTAAYLPAEQALEDGRLVYWIEDFYRDFPHGHMPEGVIYIDTAATTNQPVLTTDMVPDRLLGL